MKYTNLFLRTSKENPADETSKNAQLLIRGGFIRKTMAGVYSFLPMGLRVLRKIENIVREEMDGIGAHEILMSALANQEDWQKTGRWDTVDVLFKLDGAHGREMALSPTHEEIVTPLVQTYLRSHKDFPICVYQIQTKFRNEPRAKSGLLRGREFLMKDAYSFHTSQKDFDEYYETVTAAYHKIYARLGIGDKTKYVYASGGDFSKYSHEFQTLSEIGEDELYYIPSEDRYLNKEIVPSQASQWENSAEKIEPMKAVIGKGLIGVEALSKFLKIPVEKTTKTILFEDENGNVIAGAVRGDYEVCTNKLTEIVGCESLQLASEETVKRVTGAEVGYAGVIGLPDEVSVFFDDSMEGRVNWETGNNKTDYHAINVNFGRDLPAPETFHDIKVAKPGDHYPKTGEKYEVMRAVEVGNIFPLSTKFSEPFNFKYVDESGKEQSLIMGCYGIGVSRIMGILAELFADERGLVWPEAVAPFQVYLAAIGKNDAVYEKSAEIYDALQSHGIEVLYDDRRDKKIGPGQKFGDSELLGIPHRIVISDKLFEAGNAEITNRKTGEKEDINLDEVVGFFQ